MPELLVADRDAVRTLTLNRPATRNGLTGPLCRDAAQQIRTAPPEIRAFVVTGADGAFCSGLDLRAALDEGPGPQREHTLREDFQGLIRAITQCPHPVVAAVDGAAAGFGCDLALACDLRIASTRARFGEVFVKRGLMPDGGGTWLLPRIVGLGRALELMLTGELVDATHAHRIGLANRVVPTVDLADAAQALAVQLAAGPPLVHRLVKHSVYAGLHGDLEAALERDASGQLSLLASDDFTEGLSAFLQKREPRFTGS